MALIIHCDLQWSHSALLLSIMENTTDCHVIIV